MKLGKRITIKELSKITGVSATTITNALTGKPNVSDVKRAEIIKISDELGYKPNLHARAMVKNGIKIGVVYSHEPQEFNKYIIKSIRAAVEINSDYKIILSEHFFNDNRATFEVRDALALALADGIDGLIFAPSFFMDTYQDMLQGCVSKHKLPVIYHGMGVKGIPGIAKILPNVTVIGKMAAQILRLALGAGAVVGVVTTTELFTPHQRIVKEFVEYCGQEDIKVAQVLENEDSKTKTYDCTYKLIEKYPDIKAIYVTSFDSLTVLRCIENMGLKDKVFVIGHDVYSEMVDPLMNGSIIASIFQNPIMIGRMLIEHLCKYILGDHTVQGEILIEPQLVLRSNLECYKEYLLE